LLRNVFEPRGHWLRLKLTGTRSNRDAYGARVEVVAGGKKQVDVVHANRSYLSSSDMRLHFGLGTATKVESVVVHWPSGLVEKFLAFPADREAAIREGAGEAITAPPRK
jgi:hypothetical protein